MPGRSESSAAPARIEGGAGGCTVEHRASSREPYIRFVHVSKSFEDNRVLDDVSFEVNPGEMVVVMGKSGVGKSVILKHLMGFLRPDSGQVWVAGQEVSRLPEEELLKVRRSVTMVFQSGALFDSLTVAENVAYPLRERALHSHPMTEEEIQARVDELLGLVELSEMRERMPSDLSTGMKRSVAIARALAAEPECLLYDEPTTMVDPLMAATIGDLILKLKHQTGLTSVVVTHDVKLARKLADRVVFLVDGRVALFGSIRDFDTSEEPMVQAFIYFDETTLHPDEACRSLR
jgi:phospholipid/cholesterol/gamma-HCH transport system ATP-binding protein